MRTLPCLIAVLLLGGCFKDDWLSPTDQSPGMRTDTYDGTQPTVAMTASTTRLKAGDAFTVTFAFSEPVLGFTIEDPILDDALVEKTGLTQVDATTWSLAARVRDGIPTGTSFSVLPCRSGIPPAITDTSRMPLRLPEALRLHIARSWSVVILGNADNDTGTYLTQMVENLATASLDDRFVQVEMLADWNADSDPTQVGLQRLAINGDGEHLDLVETLPEASLTDAAALRAVLAAAFTRHPADRRVLVLSGPALGWQRGWGPDLADVWTFPDPLPLLTPPALAGALRGALDDAGVDRLDLLGLDGQGLLTCEWLGDLAAQTVARSVVGCPGPDFNPGWDLATLIAAIHDDPNRDARSLATAAVAAWDAQHRDRNEVETAMRACAAVDLDAWPALTSALHTLFVNQLATVDAAGAASALRGVWNAEPGVFTAWSYFAPSPLPTVHDLRQLLGWWAANHEQAGVRNAASSAIAACEAALIARSLGSQPSAAGHGGLALTWAPPIAWRDSDGVPPGLAQTAFDVACGASQALARLASFDDHAFPTGVTATLADPVDGQTQRTINVTLANDETTILRSALGVADGDRFWIDGLLSDALVGAGLHPITWDLTLPRLGHRDGSAPCTTLAMTRAGTDRIQAVYAILGDDPAGSPGLLLFPRVGARSTTFIAPGTATPYTLAAGASLLPAALAWNPTDGQYTTQARTGATALTMGATGFLLETGSVSTGTTAVEVIGLDLFGNLGRQRLAITLDPEPEPPDAGN